MGIENVIGMKFLEVIAHCNEKQLDFCIQMQERKEVISTITQTQCRSYSYSGIDLSMCVDVELNNGDALSHSMSLNWKDEQWVVSSVISIHDDQGVLNIKEFPEKKSDNFTVMLASLTSSASELFDVSTIEDTISFVISNY